MKCSQIHSILIPVTLNQGFTGQVMQTAKKAGATGGMITALPVDTAYKV